MISAFTLVIALALAGSTHAGRTGVRVGLHRRASAATATDASAIAAAAAVAPGAAATGAAAVAAAANAAAAANSADSSGLPTGVKALVALARGSFCAQNSDILAADGTQFKNNSASCSSNTLGLIPDVSRMVTTLITNPPAGSVLDATVDNVIQIKNLNLKSGFFDLANAQYYLAPQTLDAQKQICEGHQHITVQKLVEGDTNPPDPITFGFFKGINNAATDPQGEILQATMPANTLKESGLYRICSITGADAHQPLIMPLLVRAFTDDCIRVTVQNGAGGKNQKVAADTAQNRKITVNDKVTKQAAVVSDLTSSS
eukprot:jgi/Hompol1/6575/HPOL_002494-RA